MYCWQLAWRILSITLLACSFSILWHCLLWDWNVAQSRGHCWIFQICWHIECSTFTASSFWIWHSSTGIPSPPLGLFVVIPPKAYLTTYSSMFASKWVITPSWLSGSWRSFLYSSSVYSCHLFLMSSSPARPIPFLFLIVSVFAWNVPLVSLIILRRSLAFPFYCFPLFLCIDHWGRLPYLSLQFFRTLHSYGYTFPFLLCLLLQTDKLDVVK